MARFTRAKQVGLALHLVQRHRLVASQQSIGISARHADDVEVIQRQESTRKRSHLPCQRALARLPCAGHDYRGHSGQTLLQALRDEAR